MRGTCTWLNNAGGKLYLIPPKPGPCSRCSVYYPVVVLQTISEKLNDNASRMDLKSGKLRRPACVFDLSFCVASLSESSFSHRSWPCQWLDNPATLCGAVAIGGASRSGLATVPAGETHIQVTGAGQAEGRREGPGRRAGGPGDTQCIRVMMASRCRWASCGGPDARPPGPPATAVDTSRRRDSQHTYKGQDGESLVISPSLVGHWHGTTSTLPVLSYVAPKPS